MTGGRRKLSVTVFERPLCTHRSVSRCWQHPMVDTASRNQRKPIVNDAAPDTWYPISIRNESQQQGERERERESGRTSSRFPIRCLQVALVNPRNSTPLPAYDACYAIGCGLHCAIPAARSLSFSLSLSLPSLSLPIHRNDNYRRLVVRFESQIRSDRAKSDRIRFSLADLYYEMTERQVESQIVDNVIPRLQLLEFNFHL